MNKVTPYSIVTAPTRLTARDRVARLVLPVTSALVMVAGAANAQELEALNAKVTGGVGGIIATVGTVAAVTVGVALIIWGAMKIKPR